jgi:hypothetical protein
MKAMQNMKDGDYLLYLDCGCEVDARQKDYLAYCFETARHAGIVATMNSMEHSWNKMDLILHLNAFDNRYINAPQRQAGAILFCVNESTRQLVQKWYETGCNYHLIDDSPSTHPNLSSFKEHRHDQSIFSLLTKKYELFSNVNLTGNCIKYIRNKTGASLIK